MLIFFLYFIFIFFFPEAFYLDEQMLPLSREKPLLHSSSSVDNKYGSMCLSLESGPVDFGLGRIKHPGEVGMVQSDLL